jgi:hypothetical protein
MVVLILADAADQEPIRGAVDDWFCISSFENIAIDFYGQILYTRVCKRPKMFIERRRVYREVLVTDGSGRLNMPRAFCSTQSDSNRVIFLFPSWLIEVPRIASEGQTAFFLAADCECEVASCDLSCTHLIYRLALRRSKTIVQAKIRPSYKIIQDTGLCVCTRYLFRHTLSSTFSSWRDLQGYVSDWSRRSRIPTYRLLCPRSSSCSHFQSSP